MEPQVFLKLATGAGFSHEQANFLLNHVAQKPHTHTSTEVIVDPADGETLESFIGDLIETEVFEDGPVLHGDEDEDGEIIDVDEVET